MYAAESISERQKVMRRFVVSPVEGDASNDPYSLYILGLWSYQLKKVVAIA